jgi:hypothetical protein
MSNLEEAIEGCDSHWRTEKVRLRQKLEQRRAGAAREGTKEHMYKWPCRAKDHTLTEFVDNNIMLCDGR